MAGQFKRIRRRRRECADEPDRGSSSVEAVITIPALVIVTMLVVQFALVWHSRHTAQSAAQLAARSAATYQASSTDGQADGDAYLAQTAPNLLSARSVQVIRDATIVTVTVTASVPSVVPFASFSVDERASAPIEAFSPTGAP
jgi:Flp pilus assembly protein TadG